MLYKPILTKADFETRIKLGDRDGFGTPEDVHLDFKHSEKMKDQRELARDVSQFANTNGGALVIGVHAPKDPSTNVDTAKTVVPIPDEGKLIEWFDKALSNYLYPAAHRPRPLFFDPWGIGKVAVLNVNPSDTLLAVFRQSEAREGIEYIYRTSHGKEWFTPEEAAMRLSDVTTRATRIKMERIRHARAAKERFRRHRVVLVPPLASCKHNSTTRDAMFLPEPDLWPSIEKMYEEEFMLIIFDGKGSPIESIRVPYHYVEHAWEQHDGMLALDLKVRVAKAPSGDRWELYRLEQGGTTSSR